MPMMFNRRAVAIARAARSSRSNSLAAISSAKAMASASPGSSKGMISDGIARTVRVSTQEAFRISSAPRRFPASVISRHTASGIRMCPTIFCSKSSSSIRANAIRGVVLLTIMRLKFSLRGPDFYFCVFDREVKGGNSTRIESIEKVQATQASKPGGLPQRQAFCLQVMDSRNQPYLSGQLSRLLAEGDK